jgi:hypothetical protein
MGYCSAGTVAAATVVHLGLGQPFLFKERLDNH